MNKEERSLLTSRLPCARGIALYRQSFPSIIAIRQRVLTMASVPLLCNVCPKQPKFSDISHLLTHIGSKGHLAHYFKIQVRSRQDETARQTLQAYDDWYDTNQIESLLSERMILKDMKNPKTRNRNLRSQRLPATRSTGKTKSELMVSPNNVAEEEENCRAESLVDPQLSYHFNTSSEQQNQQQGLPPLELGFSNHSLVPYSSSVEATSHRGAGALSVKRPDTLQIRPRNWRESDDEVEDDELLGEDTRRCVYPDPSKIGQLPPMPGFHPRLRETSPSPSLYTHRAIYGVSNTTDDDESEAETPKLPAYKVPECVKLKGTVWPGMDLFDAADPEAQRRRNQKKDGAVLIQMRVASETVKPNELIFDRDGDLLKVRQITGEVESSSPIKEIQPKPRTQRVTSKRHPLNRISSNVRRTTAKLRPESKTRTKKETDESLKQISSRALAAHDNWAANKESQNLRIRTSPGNTLPKRKPIARFGGQPTKRKFKVYEDGSPMQLGATNTEYGCRKESYPWLPAPQQEPEKPYNTFAAPNPAVSSHNSGLLTVKDPNIMLTRSRPLTNLQASFVAYPHFTTNEDKENANPFLEPRFAQPGMAGATQQHDRSTQRYFTEYPSHAPRFYDHWPPVANMGYGQATSSGLSRRPTKAYQNASETDARTINPLAVHQLQRPYIQKISSPLAPQMRAPRPSLPTVALPQRTGPIISPTKRMTRAEGPEPEEEGGSSGDETVDDGMDGASIWFGSPDAE